MKSRHIIALILLSILMVTGASVLADHTPEDCDTVILGEDFTLVDAYAEDFEYTATIEDEADIVATGLTEMTVTMTVDYEAESTATVEDYGMVYAAARVYFREDHTYDHDDIQDLMEVGTVVQQCDETEGEFIAVQLLEPSVSMLNEDVPELSELGDIGWMYGDFFEVIPFEVSQTEARQIEVTVDFEVTYEPPLEDWYDDGTDTLILAYEFDDNGDPIPGVLDADDNFIPLSEITTEPSGVELVFEPPIDEWEYQMTGDEFDLDPDGNPILITVPTVSISFDPDNNTFEDAVDMAIRDEIAADMPDADVFDDYEVTDSEATDATDLWKEKVLNPETAEDQALNDLYVINGEFLDGDLQFAADTNGQFQEGYTNAFDCPGQGNSCNHRSPNAQANGYVGDVNKFGCVGRGNSCNAGNHNDGDGPSANEAAQEANDDNGSQGGSAGNSGEAPGHNK